MNRREFLSMAIAGAAVGALRRTARGADNVVSGPKIVYILADDLGYGDLSCNNPESKIATPRIDELARSGMRFTDAHSNSAVCTPTRYGILTGRYCFRSQLTKGVLYGYAPLLIEQGRMTVASFLRQQGYATACVGKWHLGIGFARKDEGKPPGEDNVDFAKPLSAGPHTVGFDYSYIIPASLDIDPYLYIENGKAVAAPTTKIERSERPAFWRGGYCAASFNHQQCLGELTKKAEAFIDERAKQKDRPFFLYFPLTSPHTPHTPRAEFAGESKAGPYGDLVVETDWTVGRILNALKRNGLEENTLVIVTSDNGAHMRGGGFDFEREFKHRSNYIYRGQKSDAWDGGHRIPFIARWPGHIAASSTCDQTICLTDLLRTSAAIVGAKLPANAGEDSCDVLPLLLGQTREPIREATVHHSIEGKFAIRQGQWKLILCRGSGGWSVKDAQAPANAPDVQLYDMKADPGEQHSVARNHADVVERLTKLLDKYRREGRSVPA